MVKPNQAATGTEAVSYRDGIGDRGDRWSIKASNDFFDSVTKSTTMIIDDHPDRLPEGGNWVHQGAVRDGYAPRSAAGAQECSGAVTLTEFVGYQSSDVGFTVYLPDGVEGYFPYTVVASAACPLQTPSDSVPGLRTGHQSVPSMYLENPRAIVSRRNTVSPARRSATERTT